MLDRWAHGEALILPVALLPEREGGREHDVRHDQESKRWLKFTKADAAGYFVELIGERLEMLPATPLQYLERWLVANRLFYDDVRLAGVWSQGSTRRIVVSQPDIVGTEPTWKKSKGRCRRITGSGDYRWMMPLAATRRGPISAGASGCSTCAPVNCVRTADGDVVPIDVIPRVFNRAEAAVVARMAAGRAG